MEAEYYAARANLRRLMRLHPRWMQPQYAQAMGMELRWVAISAWVSPRCL